MTLYTTEWGLAWLIGLIAATVITFLGSGNSYKRGMVVIIGSWLVMRYLVSFHETAVIPYNLNDAMAFVALVLFAKADALAVLYFIIFQVGVAGSLGLLNGAQTYAMADLLGFVALFCAAGGAHFDGAKLERRFGLTSLGDHLRGAALGKWI
jgi:hypothetical protein